MVVHRKEQVIAGLNSVREALMRGEVTRLVLEERLAQGELAVLAEGAGAVVERGSKEELTLLAGTVHHQGAVAWVPRFSYGAYESFVDAPCPLVVALDGVQDPQNLGAIVRSAHLLGATGVVIPQRRSAGVTPVVARVSAGAVFHQPIARAVNLVAALKWFKARGLWVMGAAGREGEAPWRADLTQPLVLVLGGEGAGLRRLTAQQCDTLLRIPMVRAGVNSFNVAAAGAILLYEIVRQRQVNQKPEPLAPPRRAIED